VSDFNGDDYGDLAVGVTFEDSGNIEDPGALNVVYGSSNSFTILGDQRFAPGYPRGARRSRPGDAFGCDLGASAILNEIFNVC
jgi:hypothetical protein